MEIKKRILFINFGPTPCHCEPKCNCQQPIESYLKAHLAKRLAAKNMFWPLNDLVSHAHYIIFALGRTSRLIQTGVQINKVRGWLCEQNEI